MARGLASQLGSHRLGVPTEWGSDSAFELVSSLRPGTLSAASSDPAATAAFAFGQVSASSAGGSSSVFVHAVSVAAAGGGAASWVTTGASGDAAAQTAATGTFGADWLL